MCDSYAMTRSQQAIRDLTRAMVDRTGNLPPLPGIYPDYRAPIVRNGSEGRELVMAPMDPIPSKPSQQSYARWGLFRVERPTTGHGASRRSESRHADLHRTRQRHQPQGAPIFAGLLRDAALQRLRRQPWSSVF